MTGDFAEICFKRLEICFFLAIGYFFGRNVGVELGGCSARYMKIGKRCRKSAVYAAADEAECRMIYSLNRERCRKSGCLVGSEDGSG